MKNPTIVARLVCPALALLILTGVTAERLGRQSPESVEGYHQEVRLAVESVPLRVGDWIGTDKEVSEAERRLLQPNAILSRRYSNPNTGDTVDLLIVHCRDARDILGHYPLVCYPGNGWLLRNTRQANYQIGAAMDIHAAEYEFSMFLPTQVRSMVVFNFLVLPDGTVTPEMKRVTQAAADYQMRMFGTGQIQLLFPARMDIAGREKTVNTFMMAIEPVLKAMESGVEQWKKD